MWGPLNSLTDETTTQLCEIDTHPDQSQFKQVVASKQLGQAVLLNTFFKRVTSKTTIATIKASKYCRQAGYYQ